MGPIQAVTATLPPGLTSEVISASADAPNDVWAVTEVGGDILHWNGSRWSVAKRVTAPPGGLFTDVIALGSRDVWAFGFSGAGQGLGAWHFDGTTWTHVTGIASQVGIASAVSPANIWASGAAPAAPAGTSIVHYNGTSWRRVTAPALTGLIFPDVLAQSATNVWATAAGFSGPQELLVHFRSGVWTRVKIPWQGAVLGWLAPDGRGGFWLDAYPTSSRSQTWVLHRTAGGQWTRTILSQARIGPLALIPGTTSLWGVGATPAAPGTSVTIWARGLIG